MSAFLRNFAAPSFWIGWLVVLGAAAGLLWAAGLRWWTVAAGAMAVLGPLAFLLLMQAVTRD